MATALAGLLAAQGFCIWVMHIIRMAALLSPPQHSCLPSCRYKFNSAALTGQMLTYSVPVEPGRSIIFYAMVSDAHGLR